MTHQYDIAILQAAWQRYAGRYDTNISATPPQEADRSANTTAEAGGHFVNLVSSHDTRGRGA